MLKIQLLFKSPRDIFIISQKWSKCFANSGSKSVSDTDCNIYWPTHNWSKAQRRKDTEVMRKQDDVKSQTSGPFALTLTRIRAAKPAMVLDNQSNSKAKFSFEETKNWLERHYTCSNPMQIMVWLKKILHTLIPCKPKRVWNSLV